jgi:hypothetical protein
LRPLYALTLPILLAAQGCAARVSNPSPFSQFDVPTLGVDEFSELGRVEFDRPIPVYTVCPTGFIRVDVYQSFWSDFARTFSFGLYSPAKTYVSCNSGAAYMIGLNHQGLVAVLRQVQQAAENTIASLP